VRKERLLPLVVYAAVSLCAIAAAYGGSVKTKGGAKASATVEDDDRKWELGPTGAAEPQVSSTPGSSSPGSSTPGSSTPGSSTPGSSTQSAAGIIMGPMAAGEKINFIGVVHDLSIGPLADKSPSCSCLTVTYGRPNSGKFKWRNGIRSTDSDTMAVAISSEGIACNMMVGGKERTLAPASIAGIEHEGKDLIVLVEEARRGIPVAHGALVKALDPGAVIIIRGQGAVPFGTPIGGGKGECKVAIGQ
jgi:hypothetical protein